MNSFNEWTNNMNNKDEIVNLGYQLITIIIELILFLLLNIHIYIYY
jgi:hypothetical protein